LALGVDEAALGPLMELWPTENIVRFKTRDEIDRLIDDPKIHAFCGAFCGEHIEGITPGEIAQAFRISFPQAPIFFISQYRTFSRDDLLGNGFHDVFIEPFDKSLLKKIYEELPKSRPMRIRKNTPP